MLLSSMRVIGIDPGTISIDLCGLADGHVFLDATIPTHDALADPAFLIDHIASQQPLDCIVGPSGYGLPLTRAADLTEDAIRLALLSRPGGAGGIGGLGRLLRALASSSLPVMLTPGVIHLPSVPDSRKVNRIDMGTADKVCVAALAIHDQSVRRGWRPSESSFILLELGGAFTAGLAISNGSIVDGIGGSSGALGARACGALDAEVAVLAGHVSKDLVFAGGAATVAGRDHLETAALAHPHSARERLARDAFLEGGIKTVLSLLAALPRPAEIVLSGRMAEGAAVFEALSARLQWIAPVRQLRGISAASKAAAQGAALLADGLAGGAHAPLVEALRIREARGSVFDHLYVLEPSAARRSLFADNTRPR